VIRRAQAAPRSHMKPAVQRVISPRLRREVGIRACNARIPGEGAPSEATRRLRFMVSRGLLVGAAHAETPPHPDCYDDASHRHRNPTSPRKAGRGEGPATPAFAILSPDIRYVQEDPSYQGFVANCAFFPRTVLSHKGEGFHFRHLSSREGRKGMLQFRHMRWRCLHPGGPPMGGT
jgi:hypothetical protein